MDLTSKINDDMMYTGTCEDHKRGGIMAKFNTHRKLMGMFTPRPEEQPRPPKKRPRISWCTAMENPPNGPPLLPYDDQQVMTWTHMEDMYTWPDYNKLRVTAETPRMDIAKMLSEVCR